MRLRLLKRIAVFSFTILAFCLWYMQSVQNPRYIELSYKNRIRLLPLLGPRGNIYDRSGKLLATNRLAFDCAVIPQEFKVDKEKIEELCSILNISPNTLENEIRESSQAPFVPAVLKKDIGKETAIAISERGIDFPGLIIPTYPIRYYPNGPVGSHLMGYLGKISEKELSTLHDYGYKTRDFVGRGGLELWYNNYLKGEDGGIQTEVDSMGRELRILGIREPQKGNDISITIDLELEKYIDSLLGEYKGAIIVMESDTGEILGLVSKPGFDPNAFVSAKDVFSINRLLTRKDYPLINRAVSSAYPPGSIFKIVTASAALELHKIREDEHLDCRGFYLLGSARFNCWRESGHNSQAITEGIKNSCNVFFFQLGRRVGLEGIADYAEAYGFGELTDVDLPYEEEGVVPNRAWKKRYKNESWYEGDTLNYAIGQGYLLVTPIQILQMANIVSTEGERVTPFLVKKIGEVEVAGHEKYQLNISKAAFRIIKSGMKKAIEDAGGTAQNARVEGLQIAGKTGTTETGIEGRTHAWFAGFSPIEKPKVSLVVFLEHGGKGGDKPCKMAADIFAKLKEMGYL